MVKFFLLPATHDGPCFPVSQALVVDNLNVSNRYCPEQLDLSEWAKLKDLLMRWSPSREEIEATKKKVSAKSRVCCMVQGRDE